MTSSVTHSTISFKILSHFHQTSIKLLSNFYQISKADSIPADTLILYIFMDFGVTEPINWLECIRCSFTLHCAPSPVHVEKHSIGSGSFLAEISVSSPQKLLFHYLKKYFLDQSIQKTFYLILKKEALSIACLGPEPMPILGQRFHFFLPPIIITSSLHCNVLTAVNSS